MEYTLRSNKTRASSIWRRVMDVVIMIAVSVLLVFLLFRLLLVPTRVRDANISSLSVGEVLLVDRLSNLFAEYSLGDIVRIPSDGGYYIRRVAALGGSVYEVREGRTFLDGTLMDESEYSPGWPEDASFTIEVGEGELLLLPDLRDGVGSLDEYVVQYNDVYGEVRFRIAPLTKISFFY